MSDAGSLADKFRTLAGLVGELATLVEDMSIVARQPNAEERAVVIAAKCRALAEEVGT